ncbi:MAG: hypothetical protein QW128_04075 [Thermoprotei archaeon]
MRMHRLEVIGLLAEFAGHCAHCDNVMMAFKINPVKGQYYEYPEHVRVEQEKLSDLIVRVAMDYAPNLFVVIYNSFSPSGFFKLIRHRILREPAFILDGKVLIKGRIPEYQELKEMLDKSTKS